MDLKEIFRHKKYDYFFAWLLAGFVFSFAVCLVILSGSTSITRLYDVGKVYEIKDNVYRTPVVREKGHQESSGKVVLDDGFYEYGIAIKGNKNQYNYFCVQLENLNTEAVEWKFDFRKQKKSVIKKSSEKTYSLHEGMNIISVPENSFNTIAIEITGENNTSFYVKKMQLRESKPIFNGNRALKIFFAAYLAYILVSGALILIWRKAGVSLNMYSWIETLQNIYISILKQFWKIKKRIPLLEKYKNGLTVFFFVLMFLYSVWVEMHKIYYDKFKYHAAVYLILLLIIIILSAEPKPGRKKWNNSLVWSWLILWVMACVSDFLLPKNFRFIGYVMIFAVGLFAFSWNNMEKQEQMIKNFIRAIHIFLGLVTLFCLTCRPEIENTAGIRYSGISRNPGIFALYLGTIFAVVLGELENSIKKGNRLKSALFYILEGCVIFSFSLKSQSLCPLLSMAGMAFIWFVRMVYFTKREQCRKSLIAVIMCAVVLLIPTYAGIDWGVKHIPQSLGISVTYEGEEPIARRQYGMVVYAGDLKEKIAESRLGQKFSNTSLSGILSGRDYYYRAYLREMNLFGHEENPKLWGGSRLPHNAIIGICHRYGVFAGVPYILMLVMVVVRTFQYGRKNTPYAAVPFYICLSSIVMSMADNVEQPFVWLPWIGLYLMMGIVFDEEAVC